MKKILIITGQTATGKTSLAIKISDIIPSILISADSRQIYKGMDIVTGKDHPNQISIKAIDIINPDEQISVAQWAVIAKKEIKKAWKLNKLPIIVGGTGLYIRALTEGIDTAGIPPNPTLRTTLEKQPIQILQEKLQELNLEKFESMNNSDRNNPRRLIRAIEVATSVNSRKTTKLEAEFKQFSLIPPSNYKEIIKKRVLRRLQDNASIKETEQLLIKYDKNLESFTGIGYRTIIDYLEGNITMEELVEKWTREELSYSKRQTTWIKKQPTISTRLDSQKDLSQLVKDVKTWYHKN